MHATIQYTTGLPGCGKSYVRCARFVPEYLLNYDGDFYSNFPWNPDVIAEFCYKVQQGRSFWYKLFHPTKKKYTVEQFRNRMKTIPKDVLQEWIHGDSGPWDYFNEKDFDGNFIRPIDGCHISIDEIHNFCPTTLHDEGKTEKRKQWQQWLGEIRHMGCTIEFITQSPDKVNRVIDQHTITRTSLSSIEDEIDPFFKITMRYWYELRAAFTGRYAQTVIQKDLMQKHNKSGTNMTWKVIRSRKFPIDPRWFKFYNSFSAPHTGGKASEGIEREYQKRSKLGIVVWFLTNNFITIFLRFFIVALVIWLCVFGGLGWCITTGTNQLQRLATSSGTKLAPKSKLKNKKKNIVKTSSISDAPLYSPNSNDIELAKKFWPDASPEQLSSVVVDSRAKKLKDYNSKSQFHIVLISVDNVVLSDGYVYQIGDMIESYPDKPILKGINYDKRFVTLSNGDKINFNGVIGLVPPEPVRVPAFSQQAVSAPV